VAAGTHYLLTSYESLPAAMAPTPTRGDNTMQSSAPEDWHMVAQNMLSNL